MKDTSAEMEEKFIEVVMSRSGQQRLKMGCSMFDSAKKIAEASILAETPEISAADLKKRIFNRIYGFELADQSG